MSFCGQVICGLPAYSQLGLWPVIKVNFGLCDLFFDLDDRVPIERVYHNALCGACIELAVSFGCRGTREQ